MLNVFAPINHLGYGVHSINFMRALSRRKVNIGLLPPFAKVDFIDAEIEEWLKNGSSFNRKDPSLMIFHEEFMSNFGGDYRIGFPVFETGIVKEYVSRIKALDCVLQTSNWGKEYLEGLGVENVHVIPEGYDPDFYNPSCFSLRAKLELLERRGVIFSHIGKFEVRKGSLDILKVFTQSLDGNKRSCSLVVQMTNMFCPTWLKEVTDYLVNLGYQETKSDEAAFCFVKNNLSIIILRNKIKDIREIFSNSHFGFYLSKAEGWGLPLMESIACGLPCITTVSPAQKEFMEKYPQELIVKISGEEVANDGVWFRGNKGNWMVPDLSSAKAILREVVENPDKYINMRAPCFQSIQDYTWENAAVKFLALLRRLNVCY